MIAVPNEEPQASPSLPDLIVELAEKRRRLVATKAVLQSARKRLEAELEPITDTEREIAEDVEALERRVRKAGMDTFRDDPSSNLRPHPALLIKVFKRLRYDPARARLWALDHKLFLAFDARSFEQVAKASPTQFDFVSIEEEPQVTIATDLDKVLGISAGPIPKELADDYESAREAYGSLSEVARLRNFPGKTNGPEVAQEGVTDG